MGVQAIWLIGEQLYKAKQKVIELTGDRRAPGFINWSKKKFDWTKRTTARYIKAWLDKENDLKKIWGNEKSRTLTSPIPEIPPGKYLIVYADPPWQYRNTGFEMSVAKKYSTLSIENLCLLEKEIDKYSFEQSVLFLWVTNPLLMECREVIESWGYNYKTNLVWIKKTHTAGFYVFGKHELLLLCTKGSNLLPIEKWKSIIDEEEIIIEGNNLVHSQKPKIVYEIIESMYPLNLEKPIHLELFARGKTRPGWKFVGNEAD